MVMALNGQTQFGMGMAALGAFLIICGGLWASTAFSDLDDSLNSAEYDENTTISSSEVSLGIFPCLGGLTMLTIGTYTLFASLIPIIAGGVKGVSLQDAKHARKVDTNVLLECPHCSTEIQLPADASGLFACPDCEQEFEWN